MRFLVLTSFVVLSACVNFNAPLHPGNESQDEDFIMYPEGDQPTELSGIPIDAEPGPMGYQAESYSRSEDRIVASDAFD